MGRTGAAPLLSDIFTKTIVSVATPQCQSKISGMPHNTLNWSYPVTVPNSQSPPQRPTSTAKQSALIRHRCLRTTHIYLVHSHIHSNTLSSSTSKVLVAPATYPHASRTVSHWIKVVSDIRGSTYGNYTPVSESLQLIFSNLKRLPARTVSLYPKVMHA
jgi:hypothetical protein